MRTACAPSFVLVGFADFTPKLGVPQQPETSRTGRRAEWAGIRVAGFLRGTQLVRTASAVQQPFSLAAKPSIFTDSVSCAILIHNSLYESRASIDNLHLLHLPNAVDVCASQHKQTKENIYAYPAEKARVRTAASRIRSVSLPSMLACDRKITSPNSLPPLECREQLSQSG